MKTNKNEVHTYLEYVEEAVVKYDINGCLQYYNSKFKDLYSWEQRFDSGLDGIDRTSMFRKKQTYQPKYKMEEGVRFQYYDLFDKKFVNP